jgi:heptosyltransferase III
LMDLALTRALGIAAQCKIVTAWDARDQAVVEHTIPFPQSEAYAVLHCVPKFNYKMWHRAGWIQVAQWLQARGLRVVLTGSSNPEELEHVASIHQEIPGAINLAGRLSLNQVACLLSRCRLYVGPDTVVTHIAAALAIPVVALYGPSNPVKWGPWPAGQSTSNPWRRHGSQRVHNVTLLQGLPPCVPCLKNGCDRHLASWSDCLLELSAERVIAAISQLLPGELS